MKRVLIFLLVALFLGPVFSACAEDEMDAEIKAGIEADGGVEAPAEEAAETGILDDEEGKDETPAEPFRIREGVTWGMTMKQVLEAEGNPEYAEDDVEDVHVVTIEGKRVAGAECVVEYMFTEDALIMACFDYDTEDGAVSYEAMEAALTGRYGEASAVSDELKSALPGEMLSDVDALSCWLLDSDTLVCLMEDVDEHELVVLFMDVGW